MSNEYKDYYSEETEEFEDDMSEDVEDMESESGEKFPPPLKAIRLKCLDCCGQQWNEVKLCPCTNCPLYHYRFGKNPFRKKREMSEEQKEAMRERMSQMRAKAKKGKQE